MKSKSEIKSRDGYKNVRFCSIKIGEFFKLCDGYYVKLPEMWTNQNCNSMIKSNAFMIYTGKELPFYRSKYVGENIEVESISLSELNIIINQEPRILMFDDLKQGEKFTLKRDIKVFVKTGETTAILLPEGELNYFLKDEEVRRV